MMQPDRWWYLSDLARHIGVPPSSLQRELAALVDAGILRKRRDGNRVYFQADPNCPFLAELQSIMTKTTGLVDELRKALEPLIDSIAWAFVYGSVARSQERSTSDIDLMIIGEVGLAGLALPLRAVAARLNRPVNPTVYSQSEFARKLKSGHNFLRAVLDKEKLFVVGNEHDLERAIGPEASRRGSDDPARTR